MNKWSLFYLVIGGLLVAAAALWFMALTVPAADRQPWMGAAAAMTVGVLAFAHNWHGKLSDREWEAEKELRTAVGAFLQAADSFHRHIIEAARRKTELDEKGRGAGAKYAEARGELESVTDGEGEIWELAQALNANIANSDAYAPARKALRQRTRRRARRPRQSVDG